MFGKRILSGLLVVVLLLGNIPFTALAAEEPAVLTGPESEISPEPVILPSAEEAAEQVLETVWFRGDASGLPDGEALREGYLHSLFYGNSGTQPIGELAGNALTAKGRSLYDYLKAQILQIAAGERAAAVIQITNDQMISWGSTGIYAEANINLFRAEFQFDTVLDALLHDCPYELYWYDKVNGVSIGGSCYTAEGGYLFSELNFAFQVVADLQGSGYTDKEPTVDTSMVDRASAAASNAQLVVTKNAAKSDYEKLKAYKEEICTLVTYDNAAAAAGSFSTDADPWQLMNVFDGDPATNVVCEGYSKAYQYLCDMSQFRGTVNCYAVSGQLDGGNHMWNHVTIGGKTYLADITNSDTWTAGSDGSLFLVGGAGSITGGYVFAGCIFTFDADTQALWGNGENSILKLADRNYEPGSACADGHTWVAATCTTPKTCSVCGEAEGEAEGHSWKAATCTAPKTCTVCYATEGTALDHQFTRKVADNDFLQSAATCMEAAVYYFSCECGGMGTETFSYGEPNGHTGGMATQTQQAICEVCGTPYGELLPPKVTEPEETEPITEPTEPEETKPVTEPAEPELMVPDAPSVKVETVPASGKPKLTWNAVEGAVKYQIWRSKTGKPNSFGLINTVRTLTTTNKNVTAGTKYYYKVRAVSADGTKSDYSNVESIVCDLAKPTGLKVTSNASTGKNVISWNAVEGADTYQVYYSRTGKAGSFTVLMTTKNLTHTHSKAQAGTKYYYKVKSIHTNPNANSALTGWYSRVCDLARPVVTAGNNATTGKVRLTWKAIPGAVKYQVWYSATGKTNTFKCVWTTKNLYFNHNTSKTGVRGYYKVKAIHTNTAANSAYSTVVSRAAK